MFTVTRWWYRYGNEGDPMETTLKEYPTYEKALAYCQRYSKGLRFCRCTIEDEKGNELYEDYAGK